MIRLLLIISILSAGVMSQKWKRTQKTEAKVTLFKSSQVFNLESAEVVPKGDLFYGISHRFNSPISEGWSDFYGLDGGASMRTKLGYGITDNFMATIGRSNRNAQLDLNLKYKIWQSQDALPLPIIFSVNAGGAYTQNNFNEIEDSRRLQYFGSLILNTMLFERLGIGISPTYVHNSLVNSVDTQYSFTLGYYLQYYIGNDMTSFIFEAIPTISGFRGNGETAYFDSYTLGVEFETGGHFFKLMVSNNTFINQSQLHLGAQNEFNIDNLRFGFQITRNFGIYR